MRIFKILGFRTRNVDRDLATDLDRFAALERVVNSILEQATKDRDGLSRRIADAQVGSAFLFDNEDGDIESEQRLKQYERELSNGLARQAKLESQILCLNELKQGFLAENAKLFGK
jgi:hypothetical protein